MIECHSRHCVLVLSVRSRPILMSVLFRVRCGIVTVFHRNIGFRFRFMLPVCLFVAMHECSPTGQFIFFRRPTPANQPDTPDSPEKDSPKKRSVTVNLNPFCHVCSRLHQKKKEKQKKTIRCERRLQNCRPLEQYGKQRLKKRCILSEKHTVSGTTLPLPGSFRQVIQANRAYP